MSDIRVGLGGALGSWKVHYQWNAERPADEIHVHVVDRLYRIQKEREKRSCIYQYGHIVVRNIVL